MSWQMTLMPQCNTVYWWYYCYRRQHTTRMALFCELRRKLLFSRTSFFILPSLFIYPTECNTMNAFEEGLSKSVCCGARLYDSLRSWLKTLSSWREIREAEGPIFWPTLWKYTEASGQCRTSLSTSSLAGHLAKLICCYSNDHKLNCTLWTCSFWGPLWCLRPLGIRLLCPVCNLSFVTERCTVHYMTLKVFNVYIGLCVWWSGAEL